MTVRTSYITPVEGVRQLGQAINSILRGKTDNTGTVTLTASQTTTVVKDFNASVNSHISLTPLTANAAAALGTTYISTRDTETFTITHANNAQTDRDFTYTVTG